MPIWHVCARIWSRMCIPKPTSGVFVISWFCQILQTWDWNCFWWSLTNVCLPWNSGNLLGPVWSTKESMGEGWYSDCSPSYCHLTIDFHVYICYR
jgi:hypothetical protein